MSTPKEQIFDLVYVSVVNEPEKWIRNFVDDWKNKSIENVAVSTAFHCPHISFRSSKGSIVYSYDNKDGKQLKEAFDAIDRSKREARNSVIEKELSDYLLNKADPVILARIALKKRGEIEAEKIVPAPVLGWWGRIKKGIGQ